jgi:outer membrane protein assembly factor BamB
LPAAAEAWTGWRGPRRDAVCPTLPQSLPKSLQMIWQHKLGGAGLGGLAATPKYVVFGDRDLDDFNDVFRCLNAADGAPVWTVTHLAVGKLDYGNTPRATPLILGDQVYLFGAFGDLHCARLETGELIWSKNLILEFGVTAKLIWGTCSSPLLADGKLIVNPGAAQASLAALGPKTGDVLWQTPGGAAGFGSPIVGGFGGVRQIVGHDRTTLGGWDIQTGQRLWSLKPPAEGDFNVPTPVQVGDRLLVGTENNGTRLYAFSTLGRIIPQPVAVNEDLAPDMSTPVVVDDRVFCVWDDLFCLDLKTLRTLWIGKDQAFGPYAAVIGGPNRVLVIGKGGELILVDARADRFEVVSRLRVFDEGQAEFYSHPAIVGDRLYIRGATSVVCVDLGGP